MNFKQLFKLTLLSSLIATGSPGSIAIAAEASPAMHGAENNTQGHSDVFSGELIETFNSGGYTYAQLKTDKGPVWAAGPITKMKLSDQVGFSGKVAMYDFYSKSLDRRFKTIYFVDTFIINGVAAGKMVIDPHQKIDKKQAAELKKFGKAKDGESIVEILNNKDSLAGKTIKVRGQVSKYTAGVMGKNWLHIRDSSTDKDITITTDANAAMDDIVLVEGKLILNKDYGHGYVYDVLVEDAKVKVESK